MSSHDVLDSQVEVDQLRSPVGPVGRHVVGRQLNPDPWFTIDDTVCQFILGFDRAVEHPDPGDAFGGKACGVKHNDLMINNAATARGLGAGGQALPPAEVVHRAHRVSGGDDVADVSHGLSLDP